MGDARRQMIDEAFDAWLQDYMERRDITTMPPKIVMQMMRQVFAAGFELGNAVGKLHNVMDAIETGELKVVHLDEPEGDA